MDGNVSVFYTDDDDAFIGDLTVNASSSANASEFRNLSAANATADTPVANFTAAAQDWWSSWNTTSSLEHNFSTLDGILTALTSAYDNESSVNATDNVESLSTTATYNWYFLLLLVFVVAGGLGNTLVCLAICLERRLQNVTNYFLLSLAVADLLVSLVVMPFGIIIGFVGYWPFDAKICDLYVTCDVLACSSSIMHMCFISIGRYLGIRNPLKTRHNSKKTVGLKIVLVWLLAMVISSPITILGMMDTENIQSQMNVCAINNQFFFIFGSLFAFYIPMVIMVVSYVLTVQLLRQQKKFGDNLPVSRRIQQSCRRLKQQQHRQQQQCASSGSVDVVGGYATMRRSLSGISQRSLPIRSFLDTPSDTTWSNNGHIRFHVPHMAQVSTCDRATQTHSSLTPGEHRRLTRTRSLRLNLPKTPSTFHLRFLATRKRSSSPIVGNSVANEQKASKVLGIVFSTFVVCWAPFFILNIVFAACPTCYVATNIVDTCLWLGYVSSTINPVIYTIFNRTFKEAFVRLLRCQCTFRRRRQTTSCIYRYVDTVSQQQTPSTQGSLRLNSPTAFAPSLHEGRESIC